MTTKNAANGIADVSSSVTEYPHPIHAKQQIENAAADAMELKADRKEQQLEIQPNHSNEPIRVVDEKVKSTEISVWTENTTLSQVNGLQVQLQAAVSQKWNVVEKMIDGNESDVEHLNDNIDNLTANLTNSVIELMAVQNELTATVARFESETKERSDQLRIANVKLGELSETNEKMKSENEEYVRKLSEQLNESHKVMKAYDKDLTAKTDLVELYRQNNVDYQAENDELAAGIMELKQLLNETVDGCGILETRLKQNESDHQMLSDAQEEIVAKLKRELNDANRLLKECASVDGNTEETGDGENSLSMSKRLTFTEIYSQYRQVLQELRNKEQECRILETEMTNLINEAKAKANEIEQQRNEVKKHRETNEKLVEERQNSLEQTVVAREELQICRLRCELLQDECNKMKSFGSGNAATVANTCVTSTANVTSVAETDLTVAINSYNSRVATDIPETKSRDEHLLQIEKLTELNRKLKNEVRELNAEKDSLAAEANLSNVRNSIRQQQFESLERQNQTYVDMIDEAKFTAKYLRDETAKAVQKLSTAEDRCEQLQNEQRSLADTKQSLTAELEMLKKELAQEKLSSDTLRKRLQVMETERLKSSTQIRMETGDSHTTISQTGVVTTDSLVEDVSNSKCVPQLTKSPHRKSESESLQSNASPVSRKRSVNEANTCDSASANGSSKRHRWSKKPRVPVALLDLSDMSEESDDNELINVWDDDVGRYLPNINSPNINLPNLSEVRPTKQSQLHDAQSTIVVQNECGSSRTECQRERRDNLL